LFRFRQAFEVCGILTDVYIACHRNARGQEFGFVRYVNVKNKEKLAQALNNVWIDQSCVWAHEAKFDRFAHNDVTPRVSNITVKKTSTQEQLVVQFRDEGAKLVRRGIQVLGVNDEGVNVRRGQMVMGKNGGGGKTVTVGDVKVHVWGEGGKQPVGRSGEGE
jgi:hypothetical protein